MLDRIADWKRRLLAFYAFRPDGTAPPVPRWLKSLMIICVIAFAAFMLLANENCLTENPQASRAKNFFALQVGRMRFAESPEQADAVVRSWEQQCIDSTTGQTNWSVSAQRQITFRGGAWFAGSVLMVVVVLLTARAMTTSALRLIGFMVALQAIIAIYLRIAMTIMIGMAVMKRWGWMFHTTLRSIAAVEMLFLLCSAVYVLVALALHAFRKWGKEDGRYEATPSDPDRATVNYRFGNQTLSKTLEGAEGHEADINAVVQNEIDYIRHHRHPDKSRDLTARSLVGLALSGGGIRSATSCLGVLQGLAQLRILPLVDYVSSVSGGGYIASCLSSLLSLNQSRTPATPDAHNPNDPAHEFPNATDKPSFRTRWEEFPFRDDRTGELNSSRAAEMIAHLRTHGSFLIARKGVLSRDTLRAVGNILNGAVYNVLGFLVALFAATALYLAIVSGTTHVDKMELVSPRVVDSLLDPAQPQFATSAPKQTRTTSAPCALFEASSSTCTDKFEEALSAADFSTWFAYELRLVSLSVRRTLPASVTVPDALPMRASLLGAMGMGLFLTAVALLTTLFAKYVFRNRNLLASPQPGESEEEVFDKSLLWTLGSLTAAILVWALITWERSALTLVSSRLVVMWIPLAFLVGARVSGFLVAILFPQVWLRQWDRRFRTLWGGYQAILTYSIWASILFLLMAPAMFALAEQGPALALSAVVSLVTTRLLAGKGASGSRRISAAKMRVLLAVAVGLTFLLGALTFGSVLIRYFELNQAILFAAGSLALLFALGWAVDMNKLSLHYFYRDRIADTYLSTELKDNARRHWTFRDSMSLPLAGLHGDAVGAAKGFWRNTAPYHLISCAINLAGSRDLTRKDRKSGYWLFSKLYSGSVHTGFRPTRVYRNGETKLGRAVAISGAAAAPGMGFHTFFAQAFATALFNVRLGYWTENPRSRRSQKQKEGRIFWPSYIWREVTLQTTDNDALVNLSDGGHTGDNVGIYPLLQRRCKVIIAVDAEADNKLTFGSFTEALRHAYIDEGITVDIDLSMIRPDKETGYSRSHCAVGRIRYPDRTDQASYLIYIKNSLTGDEPETVLNYKSVASAFPHESTADQFFTDAQFESYRALGVHIAKSVFAPWGDSDVFQFAQSAHAPVEL
ncbi:MAG: patatin-like phospholipase family protein [Gemmatimonas sp.]